MVNAGLQWSYKLNKIEFVYDQDQMIASFSFFYVYKIDFNR